MATDQMKPPPAELQGRFDWGETIRFRGDARVPGRAGAIAEVCGIVMIETVEHAKSVVGGTIGKEAYLIEFGDGESVEVVGDLLEKLRESNG